MARRHTANAVFWTKEECLRSLYAWVRNHDSVPRYREWHCAGPNHPSSNTVRRHFGSWARFLLIGGFDVHPPGPPKRWTTDAIADAMLNHLLRNGRWPSLRDWERGGGHVHPVADHVLRIFGSWRAAKLHAGWLPECAVCGKQIKSARAYQVYCSRTCNNKAWRRRRRGLPISRRPPEAVCVGCGGEFDTYTMGCAPCHDRKRRRSRRVNQVGESGRMAA